MERGAYMHEVEKAAVVDKAGLSRKKFLASAAGIVVGAGALAVLPSAAKAHDPTTDQIDLFNYVLTLEHLEDQFYQRILAAYDEDRFRNARVFSSRIYGSYIRNNIRSNFVEIGEHESAHVTAIADVVTSLGGTPVEPLAYNFGVNSVLRACQVARLLENTGVTAYAGGIAHVDSADLLTAGATIATVEARHASYLNLLLRVNPPFPDAFDDPVSPRDICEAIKPFLASDLDAPGYTSNDRSYNEFCADLPAGTNSEPNGV